MRSRYPGSYVTAVSYEAGTCLARHGVVCLPFSDKAGFVACLNGADALVFMAGIMVDTPFEEFRPGPAGVVLNPGIDLDGQAAAALLARAQDVPCLCLGIGAGPLSNPDTQSLVRLAALAGMRYLPRDEHTCELLAACGVPQDQVTPKADLAFSVCNDEILASGAGAEVAARGPYAVVSLRERDDLPSMRLCSEAFVRGVAQGLDALWERSGTRPVFVDLDPRDARIHAQVMGAMRHEQECVHLAGLGIDEVLGVIARCRMAVAMRLHASIVANAFGVPSIGFAYEDKVASFYAQMGAEGSLLPMDASEETLEALIGGFADDLQVRSEALAAPVRRGRALAQEAFDELWATIEGREPQVRPQRVYSCSTSVEQREAESLSAQLAAERDELARVRAELDQAWDEAGRAREEVAAMRASHSWRIGNALMRLPATFKRLLGR